MVLRILFVDDDANVLGGLRRMLRPLRHEWSTEFADGGPQALTLMEKAPFDVIVSDMRMPVMSGVQLLEEVCRLYPKTIRLILSGQCDEAASAKAVRVAHQMLNKPCEAETLKATVASAVAVRDMLANDQLRSLVTGQDKLPSLPSLYTELVAELDSPEPSLAKVSGIVSSDPGMAAQILRLANSAFFGVRTLSANPRQAIAVLGLETMRTLVLAVSIFSRFKIEGAEQLSIESLWKHCQSVSKLAAAIATAEGASAVDIELTAMSGLLHDIGKLILMHSMPKVYSGVLQKAAMSEETLCAIEHAAFGASHAKVGACLLGLWGIPAAVVEAVAWHHAPSDCPNLLFRPLTAVHAANAFLDANENQGAPHLDEGYLGRLNLLNRVERWRELCDSQLNEVHAQ
jgi:putative nucleotidyltransferase with HDIG domain